MTTPERRPIKTRGANWARRLAAAIADRGVSPDSISMVGVLFALAGAAALLGASRPATSALLLIAAAVCIQLRLLANMLDGLVAVEGGRSGALGNLYNEFPDRVEDVLLIGAAGVVAAGVDWPVAGHIGWIATVLALLVAHVRALAGGIGGGHPFHGPMAKPQRMFLLTVACLLGAGLNQWTPEVMFVGLAMMSVGMVITIWRRLSSVAATLRAR